MSVLLLANIRDILVISSPEAIEDYRHLLGDGSRIGVHIEYAVQEQPRGLAEAFIIGELFIGDDSVCLVLGDNVFYGQYFSGLLQQAREQTKNGAAIFSYPVTDPSAFGVVEFDEDYNVVSIEEIAWRRGFIDDTQLRKLGQELSMTEYGQYLLSLAGE